MNKSIFPIIAGMQPVAEAGFPDVMCPVIFLQGCNMKCPYCLNADLVIRAGTAEPISVEEVTRYLKENGEEHVLISGGEACMNPGIVSLVDHFTVLGLKVRISTNGSRPEVLSDLIRNHGLSFAAMDIKTDLYNREKWSQLMNQEDRDRVMESISILNSMVGNRTGFTFEFRTTLFPPSVGEPEIRTISGMINRRAVWFLQQFRPKKGLLGGEWVGDVKAYDDATLNRFLRAAKENVINVYLRWP